ncbi:MAG: GFA family protein [Betaproteobacteria bacterium]|nr:GFA family protein [Betaproteobacteria bacterium]
MQLRVSYVLPGLQRSIASHRSVRQLNPIRGAINFSFCPHTPRPKSSKNRWVGVHLKSGTEMTDTHLGGCACGAVRYRVLGNPVLWTVCHCRFCQRRLTSAFAVLVSFKEDAVETLQGEQSKVEYRSDESGRWLRMSFCPKCGTTISHAAEIRPGMRTIAGGTFDDPTWFPIDRHIWVQSKLPWVSIPPDVAAYAQGFVAPPS